MQTQLIALILRLSLAYNIPPYLVVAIAEVESSWRPEILHVNDDGTIDFGLLQLNSSWFNAPNWWDPETNIIAGLKHITFLRAQGLTWYQVVITYNCGLGKLKNPPNASLDYAQKVFEVWANYDKEFVFYIGR